MATAVKTQFEFGAELPPGFTLVDPPQTFGAELPPGFTLIEEPGFIERIGERLGERREIFQEITAEPPETQLESLGKGFDVLGSVIAGGALDIAGEVVSTGFGLLSDLASKLTPDVIEGPIREKVKEAFTSAVGTDLAQAAIRAAGQGAEAFERFETENPGAARKVRSAANIALAAIPVKVAPKAAPKPGIVGRAGERVGVAAEQQATKKKADFISELVRTPPSKSVLEAEALRTTSGKGLFGQPVVTPSATEARIAKAVSGVKGVKESNSFQKNLEAIITGKNLEAENLASILKASKVKIPRSDIEISLNATTTRMAKIPALIGDPGKRGKILIDEARDILRDNPKTPSGVLKSRKQFDKFVRSFRSKIFDPASESALSIAVRETRRSMNDIIEKSVPTIAVRKSLDMQSNLFRAIDNIAPKVALESGTQINRLAERVGGVLGGLTKLDRLTRGALGVLGVVISSATVGVKPTAAVIGTAVTAVAAKRFASSVAMKKALRSLLLQTDKAIQVAKKGGRTDTVKQLRLDRAAVIEVFENIGEDEQ